MTRVLNFWSDKEPPSVGPWVVEVTLLDKVGGRPVARSLVEASLDLVSNNYVVNNQNVVFDKFTQQLPVTVAGYMLRFETGNGKAQSRVMAFQQPVTVSKLADTVTVNVSRSLIPVSDVT